MKHYRVIGNLTDAMAKRCVLKACGKGCRRDITHTSDRTCSDSMPSPPCVSAGIRIPCADCNRHFRSQASFNNHKTKHGNKKAVCERKRKCGSCGAPFMHDGKHECGKQFSVTCKAKTEIGYLCYMQPLKNVLPPSNRVLYVFCNFEATQNTRYSDTAIVHVPNICIQQFCSQCESTDDVRQDCAQCSKRKHSFRIIRWAIR